MSNKQSDPRSTAMLTGANSQADTTVVQYPAGPTHVNENTLSAALKLAVDGIPVFPCKPNKKPYTDDGFKDATTNEDQIRSWWKQWPHAMIGMPTGTVSGVLVLDVDNKNSKDGSATLAELTKQHGPLPTSRTHSTPSGGQHLLFRYPANREVRCDNTGKVGTGLDVKGKGGYVIVPPSLSADGKGYAVTDDSPMVEAPDWLLDRMTSKKAEYVKTDPERHPRYDARSGPYERTPVERLISNLESTEEGERNETLNKTAYLMARHVVFGELSEEEARVRLFQAALTCGLEEDEALRTIESGLTAGVKYWRTVPVSADSTGGSTPFFYTVYSCADILNMPPPQWRVKDVLPATGLAAIFGPSRAGKSFLALDLAFAITRGSDWFDWLTVSCPVLYVYLESFWGLRARLKAWAQDTGHEFPKNLHFITDPFNLQDQRLVQAIIDAAPKNGVVIIDTLNRATPGSDENSSKDMSLVIKAATEIQTATNGLVLFVAHSGKNEALGIRGHTSFIAALDAAIEVTGKDNTRKLKLDKVKEGQDGVIQNFQLKTVMIAFEPNGTGSTSCVVEPVAYHVHRMEKILRGATLYALNSLQETIEAKGTTSVHLEDWRSVFYAGNTGESRDAKRQAFGRARKKLVEEGFVHVHEDMYGVTA